MTEQPTATSWEPAAPAPDEVSAPPDTSEHDDELAGDDEPIRDMRHARRLREENKRLRHQLREAQENYGGAAARLAAAERREIARQAGAVLIDPEDIYRYTDAETQKLFVDEQFHEVVGDNVVQAAKALAAQRPHLAKPNTSPPPSDRPVESLRPGASPEQKPAPATWFGAIRGG